MHKNIHANIVVISYNRPRMLAEALESIYTQTYQDFTIWLYDDGSDQFDVEEFASRYDDRLILCLSPKISLEERVRENSNRWPDNLNAVMDEIPRGEFVLYLCDDDILHYDWLECLNGGFNQSPRSHIIIGDLYWFLDGENPYVAAKKGFMSIEPDKEGELKLWWSLGGFAHRSDCHYDCNVRWGMGYKGYAHSYDVSIIDSISENHVGHLVSPTPASYRREHDNTLSARLGRIEGGAYVKTGGEMVPKNVAGEME